MLRTKLLIPSILIISTLPLLAQEKSGFTPDFRVSQSTSVSSGSDLPFWMTANQNGVFTMHNNTYLLTQAGLIRDLKS